MHLTQTLLDRLCCPACYGSLLLADGHIDCVRCHRHYPIMDGLPILIATRASLPE